MITVVMSAVIGSERERVWRALTDPAELVAWDERLLARIDPDDRYPAPDRPVRWRYRLGPVQLVLAEHPTAVVPMERLSAERRIGSLRFEQTFQLAAERNGAPNTRLAMKVVAGNRIPVVGDVVDRFAVRRLATSHVDQTLRSLQRWCERRC